MTTITFDTLAYSRKLQAAGVDPRQAEAMAEAQKEAFDQMIASRELATKSDLMELKIDLIRWLLGSMLALAALLIAAMAYIHV